MATNQKSGVIYVVEFDNKDIDKDKYIAIP